MSYIHNSIVLKLSFENRDILLNNFKTKAFCYEICKLGINNHFSHHINPTFVWFMYYPFFIYREKVHVLPHLYLEANLILIQTSCGSCIYPKKKKKKPLMQQALTFKHRVWTVAQRGRERERDEGLGSNNSHGGSPVPWGGLQHYAKSSHE